MGITVDVEENDGEVEGNDGEVEENDGDVEEDDREVEGNDGEVEENDGEVEENDGEVEEDDREVEGNDGEVEGNDGEVEENDGEVEGNVEDVEENDGEFHWFQNTFYIFHLQREETDDGYSNSFIPSTYFVFRAMWITVGVEENERGCRILLLFFSIGRYPQNFHAKRAKILNASVHFR